MTWPLVLPAALLCAGAALAAWWVRHRYVAVTVRGYSMVPTLSDGDRVLIRRGWRGLRRDDIVVVACPDVVTSWRQRPPVSGDLTATEWFIKRAVALAGDAFGAEPVPAGHLAVVGDSIYSDDSRYHGPCPVDQVLGVMVRVLGRAAPADAAGGSMHPNPHGG
ncbi:S26 family signal peptidase [Streptomyces albipurpureus]|uniref:S26 family signal peptidase n=1 Tax=Streptomyces albipurpureus TaxID=2897419 RepID=A0ABT0UI21_9ACTN|nr:S26 family signal peptidase [Streptomyces sp. CWNU-1]MCM2388312.1 S26 family signal peptidase [Streptomyces sp. CWNU-1]